MSAQESTAMSVVNEQLSKYEKIENFLKGFKVSTSTYKRVMHLLQRELNVGLAKETHPISDLRMLPSFVRSLPNGSEKGEFLALDLGGTNFRVLLVTLDGMDIDIQSKTYLIPQRIMLGTGIQLFDHIAECIGNFVHVHHLEGHTLPLGFTFSFPCKQEGLAKARLTKWTKGFRCEGVEGKDICEMLHEALLRKGNCNVEVAAIVNDTVGTLISAAHQEHNCRVGLIVGTGCNASYMEKLENVEIWEGDKNHPDQVAINCEWGAFGSNGCLDFMRTEFDRELDIFSINPGKQIFEKMIGGMYIGEVMRLVLERLAMEGLLFQSVNPHCHLFERGRFFTKYISEIESDTDDLWTNTKRILGEIGIEHYTTDDCKIVKYICTLISARAAFLAASGVSTLINRLNLPDITVGVDGSLYRFHPRFPNLMHIKIQELINPGLKFKIRLSDDGSGKGAALTAAVSMRLRNTKHVEKKISSPVKTSANVSIPQQA
ncbi:hexokinase type 2-like [Babylonia areolata]|uniref:hexokinase type 2-like n=1 Tax=Babylonia areolata TaxID=304850 RepID=UPI003FD30E8B